MRLKSEEEAKLFFLPKEIDMIIHIIILYLLNLLTTLDLDLNILSLITIFNYFWNLGENPVQPSTPRKKTRKPGKKTRKPGKKTRKPGKKFFNWFAKQKHLLTSNGSSTCSEIRGYKMDRLHVSDEEIGKGSNGTVVFKGRYDGREVAVKRFKKTLDNEALKQVQNLTKSDHHPNIVRLHGVERDNKYVYLALEHCFCSLSDLVSLSAKCLKTTKQDITLWKSNGYPSALLLRLMRDMVHGLVHLQELDINHEDITPQNVMIAKGLNCAKLSEIGVTDPGSSRQFPPKHKHKRWAADMFSLGSVFYFCLSQSSHSSDHHHLEDDDINIGNYTMNLTHIPEALDLLSHLLDPNPKMRPMARQVLHHPMFWDSDMRLSFLRDVSDRLTVKYKKHSSEFSVALESVRQRVFGASWDEKMESELVNDINRCRKYNHESVRHLLRVVRNKLNHYHESPNQIKELLGSLPEGLDDYFSCRFPRLLIEVYNVVISHCRSEKAFERYFGVDSVPIVL